MFFSIHILATQKVMDGPLLYCHRTEITNALVAGGPLLLVLGINTDHSLSTRYEPFGKVAMILDY